MDPVLGNRMLKEVEEFTLEQVSGYGFHIVSMRAIRPAQTPR